MSDKAPEPKKNKRLMSGVSHVGGPLIEREVSIYDGLKMDKRGLTLRDYQ